MFQNLPDFIAMSISIILSGISIKMLDDYIDDEEKNFVPYIFLFLCISISLWKESSSLFLSAYIVGMFHDENLRLISGLKTYQEQIIVLLICILISGITAAISSLCIICAIQIIDDLIDAKEDKALAQKNWVLTLGLVESIIIMFVFLTLSLYFSPVKTLLCISWALLLSYLFKLANVKKG